MNVAGAGETREIPVYGEENCTRIIRGFSCCQRTRCGHRHQSSGVAGLTSRAKLGHRESEVLALAPAPTAIETHDDFR